MDGGRERGGEKDGGRESRMEEGESDGGKERRIKGEGRR